MILNVILVLGAILCAFQALRTKQLLSAALWLASTSAFVACLLYALGAYEVAVIELSVGAGLVTVLFVFGISIAGEDAMGKPTLIPWVIAGGGALIAMGLVAWFTLPSGQPAAPISEPSFSVMLWEQRGLDVLVQIGLIFAGVLGILGILAEKEPAPRPILEREQMPAQTSLPQPQPAIIEGNIEGAMQEVTA
jgi:uncharacterized MnhB-related membrane protein